MYYNQNQNSSYNPYGYNNNNNNPNQSSYNVNSETSGQMDPPPQQYNQNSGYNASNGGTGSYYNNNINHPTNSMQSNPPLSNNSSNSNGSFNNLNMDFYNSNNTEMNNGGTMGMGGGFSGAMNQHPNQPMNQNITSSYGNFNQFGGGHNTNGGGLNNNSMFNNRSSVDYNDPYANEPPLMEELGINFDHILRKTKCVINPFRSLEKGMTDHGHDVMQDTDLAGPLCFCLGLGVTLLMTGKVHFGYIYGFGVSGCILMYLLLSLLSSKDNVDFWLVASILGYCLLPVCVLSTFSIFLSLTSIVGHVLSIVVIAWCTTSSTRFFEKAFSMRDKRYLIAYPVGLLYSIFVLITIF